MGLFTRLDFRRTPVVLVLMGIMVAIEIVSSLSESRREYFYNDLRLGIWWTLWQGEYWQPFTTTLLHVNFLHALFNLWWFVVFGEVLEKRLGSARFLGLVVLLAYVSSLAEFAITSWKTLMGCAGFSGVIYGLFGFLWAGRRWRSEFLAVCDRQTVQILVFWFLLCILLTWSGTMPVANIAHGAGLAFGYLYGLAAYDRTHQRRWLATAVAASALVLAVMIACPGHAGYEHVQLLAKPKAL